MATTIKKATSGKDKLIGTASADKFSSLAGNDTLNGMAGNDTLDGGAGDDLLDGGAGNDSLLGGDGNDILLGGSGNDFLSGDKGNDKIDGGVGNDTLNGGIGSDAMTGGDGNDYYFVDNKLDTVVETNKNKKTGGIDSVETALNYVLGNNVENLILTGITNNNGTGNKSDNVITGNIGDNLLKGDVGNDTLIGGDGVDTLDGGLGMDILNGGAGADVYFMNNTEDQIIEDAQSPDEDQIIATVSYDLSANPEIEILTVQGKKAIFGTGNDLDNTLQETEDGTVANNFNGGAGNDVINAEGGNDTLEGGEGNDELNGGAGNDVAIYNGLFDDYQITPNVDVEGVAQLVIKHVNPSDIDEGEDILTDIEIVQFADGSTINTKDVRGKLDDNNATEPLGNITTENEAPKPEVKSKLDNALPSELYNLNYTFALEIPLTESGDKFNANDDTEFWVRHVSKKVFIFGLDGDDIIQSSKYTDSWISGGSGNDIINAGDNGMGASTSDTLVGGSGVDYMDGGAGNNTFIFGLGDSLTGKNADTINGFGQGFHGLDYIDLRFFERPLAFIDTKSFSDKDQVRIATDFANKQTIIQINLDVDLKDVESEIRLNGLIDMIATDFLL